MKTTKGKLTENWKLAGDSTVGKSYQVDLKSDSTLLEKVVIKKIGNDIYFCVTGAQEDKTKMVKFKLIPSEKNLIIFENKQHDFPQRIYYKKVGQNELLAWIEGGINGKDRKVEFHYHREK